MLDKENCIDPAICAMHFARPNNQGWFPRMATWSDLDEELGRWRAAGRKPTLWWRDDDAHAATPSLDRLLELSDTHHVPVHLAVIPDLVRDDLSERLEDSSHVHLLQHGFAHLNHEPAGPGASEFGENRDMEQQRRDLRAGWQRLVSGRLRNLVPGFVPPWNRVSDATLTELPGLGYRIVSAFPGSTSAMAVDGLIRADAHVDPIRWKHGRQFRGTEATLELFLRHLSGRRNGRINFAQPTGFLTHHLQTDDEIWNFADHFFERLAHHGIARWICLSSLIPTR